ncbi:MAG: O-antigen ligase family protein, partial [Cyanobacteria bacterium NC_groundwater_1444_Ag_S-0.65um_54_12]|nr:O-antigen ligase family protein [Cyanobacteria bacterium NC_groundwater_1444_Ag_S-0.65um_54_12]
LSMALAIQIKAYYRAIFLGCSILSTLSTGALFSALLYLGIIGMRMVWRRRTLKVFAIATAVSGLAIFTGVKAVSDPFVNGLVVQKVFVSRDDSSWTDSREVRLDLLRVGMKMFISSPLFGTGLAQYGFRYREYADKYEGIAVGQAQKTIPNNVYIELLAESGLVGFVLFVLFTWRALSFAAMRALENLQSALIAMLVMFLAFPSFSIMYVWFFLGIIFGLREQHSLLAKTQARN